MSPCGLIRSLWFLATLDILRVLLQLLCVASVYNEARSYAVEESDQIWVPSCALTPKRCPHRPSSEARPQARQAREPQNGQRRMCGEEQRRSDPSPLAAQARPTDHEPVERELHARKHQRDADEAVAKHQGVDGRQHAY
jgi:hypothetical protein